jgi:hypothetical protein
VTNNKVSNGICRCRFSHCNALYTSLYRTTIEGKASRWLKAQIDYLLQAESGHRITQADMHDRA